jgi:hypothetical protein
MLMPQVPPTVMEEPDWLELNYGQPEPPECIRDSDCGNGCCRQIGNQFRMCYPDSDNSCHLRWVEPPPSNLPRWDPSQLARYTGSFTADVVSARVEEVWSSGQSRIFKLNNGQYWEELLASGGAPGVGAEVRIAPAPFFWSMDAGALTSSDLLGVMQLPVIADTEVSGPFDGMESNGVYAVGAAGYWRVHRDSPSRDRRVLLTTPNNIDYWLYTPSTDQNHVDPTHVFADGEAITATDTEFSLNDGTRWGYVVTPQDPLSVGVQAVVFRLALHDDRKPDEENRAVPYVWHQGGSIFGEWVTPL